MTVLASFEKDHLINHGIKINHIHSHDVDCITFNDLILQYNFDKLGLIVMDTEGYDSVLVKDFIENSKLRPVIIFEWIHMKKQIAENIINLLKVNNYEFIKIDKDLICFQNNSLFSKHIN